MTFPYNLLMPLTYRAPKFEPFQWRPGPTTVFIRDGRDPYQRDLGRIIHSASFRRLQAKTQVMGTGEGDFHRTRLTHSLEVGHISRGIVWHLRNICTEEQVEWLPTTELIEAISYAHDLGHPPFGHGGERALFIKMRNYGGFEGNAQNIRILARLEKYYNLDGIRPTRRLLLGILKYPAAYSSYAIKPNSQKPPKCYYDSDEALIGNLLSIFSEKDIAIFCEKGPEGKPHHKTFDCSIMELADDIAYGVHDLEDGVARGILRRDVIEDDLKAGFVRANVPSVDQLNIDTWMGKLFSKDSCDRKHAISLLVGLFINNIALKVSEKFDHPLLRFQAIVPPDLRFLLDHLSKDITFKSVVDSREVQTLETKGQNIISALFDELAQNPLALVGKATLAASDPDAVEILDRCKDQKTHWQDADDGEQRIVARAICDFIAGMTNPYAEKYHRRLFEPGYGSSTDEL
ncbi:dNTP triphosphohydrolase [Methylobacterium sp. WL122]|nr:dNTP triphosphohydrolase [Methylobacterium sp. WL122]